MKEALKDIGIICDDKQANNLTPNKFSCINTFYKDDIEGKRGDICLGIHSIFSVKGITFGDIAQAKDLSKAIYNAYVTPYAEIPLSGIASIETIAQIGVLDITGSPSLNFSLTIGAKRVF